MLISQNSIPQRLVRILTIAALILFGIYLFQPQLMPLWLQDMFAVNAQPVKGNDILQQAKNQRQLLLEKLKFEAVSAEEVFEAYAGFAASLCLHKTYRQMTGQDEETCESHIAANKMTCQAQLLAQMPVSLQQAREVKRYGKGYTACLMASPEP